MPTNAIDTCVEAQIAGAGRNSVQAQLVREMVGEARYGKASELTSDEAELQVREALFAILGIEDD